jgi:hypothetical protein
VFFRLAVGANPSLRLQIFPQFAQIVIFPWWAVVFPGISVMASSSRLWVLLLVFLPLAAPAQPAAPVQITLGQAAVPLYGPWKFHIGDSPIDPVTHRPLWAEPNFNDSKWETVDLTSDSGSIDPSDGWKDYVPGWKGKGHPTYWGYAWYRIRVLIDPLEGNRKNALAIWDVDDAYEFFANGLLIGSFGKFSGFENRPVAYWSEPEMFVLPQPRPNGRNSSQPWSYALAFRVWMEPNTLYQNPDAGGLHIAPVLGEYAAVAGLYQSAWLGLIRNYAPSFIEAFLYLLLAIAAGSLILFDRSDRVYLWLAGAFLVISANAAHTCLVSFTQAEGEVTLFLVGDALLTPLVLGMWVMVWWSWFRLRRPAWVPKAILGLTVLYGILDTLGEDLFFTAMPHSISSAFHIASLVTRLAFLALLGLIVFWGIRLRGREAWLALPAVVLVGIAQFQIELLILHVPIMWFPFGFGVYFNHLADAVLALVIFVLLLRRLLLSVRRQREMALDVKQAQEVQRVILPEPLTSIPGLTIQSEYRPAREVGGDFFQIIPCAEDNSLLVIAGDVTGRACRPGCWWRCWWAPSAAPPNWIPIPSSSSTPSTGACSGAGRHTRPAWRCALRKTVP